MRFRLRVPSARIRVRNPSRSRGIDRRRLRGADVTRATHPHQFR